MNHKILLLSRAPPRGPPPALARADANGPGQHWTASVQAETSGKYADAINELRAFDQQGGDPFLTAERSGWLNYLSGNYATAEQAYARAKQIQPTAINPLLGLLLVAQAQKDAKEDRARRGRHPASGTDQLPRAVRAGRFALLRTRTIAAPLRTITACSSPIPTTRMR